MKAPEPKLSSEQKAERAAAAQEKLESLSELARKQTMQNARLYGSGGLSGFASR